MYLHVPIIIQTIHSISILKVLFLLTTIVFCI
nr:MAG TPA: hypothetical protein [Caudoviricetes sp.]